jgi:16S rRNA (cytosine1402-N4)-methyltransferase
VEGRRSELRRHIPVMPEEVLQYLNPQPGAVIVDGTVGEGGHSKLIADKIGPQGRLICCDIDNELLEIAEEKLNVSEAQVDFIRDNFKNLPDVLPIVGIDQVDGFFLDLGVSIRHFEDPGRGFSFRLDGPLDMRLDRERMISAADLVNRLSADELENIFRDFGEEKMARRIARAIVKKRGKSPIRTTLQLAEIAASVQHASKQRIDPATRVFQALRIAVNEELDGLYEFIIKAARMLRKGGRMVVISFHSLEDRLVKAAYRFLESNCICPPDFPVCKCDKKKEVCILTKKPRSPSEEELQKNPHSRSAKLRACERI